MVKQRRHLEDGSVRIGDQLAYFFARRDKGVGDLTNILEAVGNRLAVSLAQQLVEVVNSDHQTVQQLGPRFGHPLKDRAPGGDNRIAMAGFGHEIGRLAGAAANLDGGDAAQKSGVDERPRIGLYLDEISVDLNRDLDLFKIVRIDSDIDDAADSDAIVLDQRAITEPSHRSFKEYVIALQVLREFNASKRHDRYKAKYDNCKDKRANGDIMSSRFHLFAPIGSADLHRCSASCFPTCKNAGFRVLRCPAAGAVKI